MSDQKNPIRLTDKFIIQRPSEERDVLMTADGFDLQDFVLELQSDFTKDIETRVLTLENTADSLEVGLSQQRNIEAAHEAELYTEIGRLSSESVALRSSVDVQKQQIDELYQTTRIIARYHLEDLKDHGDNGGNLPDGSMGFKYRADYQNPEHQFKNVDRIYFRSVDLIALSDADADPNITAQEKSFKNIFPGDIIELTDEDSLTFRFRATYQVDKVKEYSNHTRVTVTFIDGAGDNGGGTNFPWQKLEDGDDRRNTRVELFPSVALDAFAEINDYVEVLQTTNPIGMVMAWVGKTAPAGWLLCNGSKIPDGLKYDELRTILGGDNTPNMKGRAAIGVGDEPGLTTVLTTVEQSTAQPLNGLKTDSQGQHNHTHAMGSAGSHTHGYGNKSVTGGGAEKSAYGAGSYNYKTTSSGGHKHSLTINPGGSHKHSIGGWDNYTRMNSYTVNWIVKAYHESQTI